jgi:hypothetical protein
VKDFDKLIELVQGNHEEYNLLSSSITEFQCHAINNYAQHKYGLPLLITYPYISLPHQAALHYLHIPAKI